MFEHLVAAATLMNSPFTGKYVIGFDIDDEEDRYTVLKYGCEIAHPHRFRTLHYYLEDWFRINNYTDSRNVPGFISSASTSIDFASGSV